MAWSVFVLYFLATHDFVMASVFMWMTHWHFLYSWFFPPQRSLPHIYYHGLSLRDHCICFPAFMLHSFLSTLPSMRLRLCLPLLFKIFTTFHCLLTWPTRCMLSFLLTHQVQFLSTASPNFMICSGLWQYQAPFYVASGILYLHTPTSLFAVNPFFYN